MLVVYEFGNSVCCQKVRLVLCEKAVAWESRQVNLFRSEQYDPIPQDKSERARADAGARRPPGH